MLNIEAIIAATNFAKWVCLAGVGLILTHYLWTRYKTGMSAGIVGLALAGAALEAFGWSAHRLYWWAWRQMRGVGKCGEQDAQDYPTKLCGAAELLATKYLWVTMIPSAAVLIGAALLASPLTMRYFGNYWILFSVVAVAGTWLLGLSIAMVPVLIAAASG